MAKDRNLPCSFYIAEGSCERNREGTFWSYCQTCNLYNPKKGSKFARKDLRKEKLTKIEKDRRNWE